MNCLKVLDEEYISYWLDEIERNFPNYGMPKYYLGIWHEVGGETIPEKSLRNYLQPLQEVGFDKVDDIEEVFFPYTPLEVNDIIAEIDIDWEKDSFVIDDRVNIMLDNLEEDLFYYLDDLPKHFLEKKTIKEIVKNLNITF